MTEFDTLPPHLQRLGRQLVTAAEQLHRSGARSRPWWRRPSRRAAAGLVAATLAIPAAALAATQLISAGQVATSLPQGAQVLIGTNPHCTVVRANVEYHCLLASPPNNDLAPEIASSDGEAIGKVPAGSAAALAIEPDGRPAPFRGGRPVFFTAPTMAALKRQLAAAKVDHAAIADQDQTLWRTPDDRITVRAKADSSRHYTDWKGTVEETVDATKHVNGACRALTSAGTDWECYIGEAAVQQRIISQDFLGEYAPGPSQG